MGTYDISRINFDAEKHYASVRMQQGRVLTDDDWNEDKRIQEEVLRRSRVDIIGPFGSPDAGFKIEDPKVVKNDMDFDIQCGTLHLGGMRLELETGERYRQQKDWLQKAGDLHEIGKVEGGGRYDLVYIEAWQQAVSAVEDESLFEVALGGPDTTTRLRNMRRVRLAADIGVDNCADAWTALKKKWVDEKRGQINKQYERITDAKLQVIVDKAGLPEDLCTPTAAGGYLGAENQAIRVQIVDDTHFTWGFDNASPLYRVTITVSFGSDGESIVTVTMLTAPKDQCHWPLSGQVVEILPWSAVLPNGEKVAEETGHLTIVETSYNPDLGEYSGEFTIRDSVDGEFANGWESWEDKKDLKPKDGSDQSPFKYYYLRVWNRGDDIDSEPKIPTGKQVKLGNTGLKATITGSTFFPGDYWVIAARPETPNEVVPWELEQGMGPHGVRRFYAPLAIIRWNWNDQQEIVGEVVHDCRKKFKPLTEQRCCCAYSVGDGKRSFGDFDSIQEAVDNLPEAGGEICLLPGHHETNTRIEGSQNIVIKGCGDQTFVYPAKGEREDPIFYITNSEHITLEKMEMVSFRGVAVKLESTEDREPMINISKEINIRFNRILAGRHAIFVDRGSRINIQNNLIGMLDIAGADAAIYLMAEDSLIERNRIGIVSEQTSSPAEANGQETNPLPKDPTDPCVDPEVLYVNVLWWGGYWRSAWNFPLPALSRSYKVHGGIQLAGGCERVTVLENEITGGAGNGITLGGVWRPSSVEQLNEEEGVEGTAYEHDFSGHTGDYLRCEVQVINDSTENPQINFNFRPPDSIEVISVSTTSIYFEIEASPGKYLVSLTSPFGYKIKEIIFRPEPGLNNPYLIIVEKKEEGGFMGLSAFLYEIDIKGNLISEMGLSGIGTPIFSLLDFAQNGVLLESRIEHLTIKENQIFHCWQNPLRYEINSKSNEINDVLKMSGIGIGGISLGPCLGVAILDNRIENNGTDHLKPTCGIYIRAGEDVNISGNRIVNNGPIAEAIRNGIMDGRRGGIVVNVSSFSLTDTPTEQTSFTSGRLAACIHHNIVEQPVGLALDLYAFGPLSILGNIFNSEFGHPSSLAGGVQIKNDGKLYFSQHSNPVDIQTHGPYFDNEVRRLPRGNTLFNDNQTCLGPGNRNIMSQHFVVLDDLGFDGNQSYNFKKEGSLLNTFLWASTLRANNSRFREPIGSDLSLLTYSLLFNNTTNNQGDHCILALSQSYERAVNSGNQFLDEGFCKDLKNSNVNELFQTLLYSKNNSAG